MTLLATRLRSQRLAGAPLATPEEVVGWFGAIQSQDYWAAKWAVGQRTGAATEADLDRLYDAGTILRTHVMRPTWHFVLPADVRWLLELTRDRVHQAESSRRRDLGMDADFLRRGYRALEAALAGRALTRTELRPALAAAGLPPSPPHELHLFLAAELDGLIVSGPRRGRQPTYALLEERVPPAPPLPRDEALAELARRYFRSHGPAQPRDFAWWSGLLMADVRRAIALLGDERETDGAPPDASGLTHLLPNFDEFTVAYADRSAVGDRMIVMANVVLEAGRQAGVWRRQGLRITAELSRPVELEQARTRLERYLERPLELVARELGEGQ